MNYTSFRDRSRRFALLGGLGAIAFAAACGGDDGSAEGGPEASGDETAAASTGMADGSDGGPAGTGSADGGSSGMADDTSASASASAGTGDSGDTGEPQGIECLNSQFVSGVSPGPDYSTYDVAIGSHCNGTNQQDITDIERVVFVGDSVTVGTPPSGVNTVYRSLLADQLVALFGLEPPAANWKQYDLINGTSVVQTSGDFSSCAVWGAQNEDLMPQLEQCFADPADFDLRTLVVFTMGGNDGASLAKDYLDGARLATVLEELDTMVAFHEMAVDWLVGDPDKFPHGVFVVNANVYEFTDRTMDFLSCPAASLAGFNSNPDTPDVLVSSLLHINEEYIRIAEENGTDVVFMSEGFCGHGFHSGDAAGPCYRGEGNETWFDLSCIHPTPTGHGALAEMFYSVIAE